MNPKVLPVANSYDYNLYESLGEIRWRIFIYLLGSHWLPVVHNSS